MSFQVFPNWCKKIGLTLFIITSLLTAGDSFMDGFKAAPEGTHHFFNDLYGKNLYHFLSILPTVGLLIYMLSKEKIEDDYIKLLRLTSYQLTVVVLLLVAFLFYSFLPQIHFSLDMALSLFMLLFLSIFYFKKNQEV